MIINSYFLIAEAVVQFFNATAELVIPVGIPTNEAMVEIEMHPVIGEAKIGKCLI